MPDRLFYYGGSLIHNQMEVGKKTYVVKSVLVCCIARYNVPHNGPVPKGKVFFRYKMLECETHEIFDGDKMGICFLELKRFAEYMDPSSDIKEQWCWIFNNLSNFAVRPKNLDSSFDDLIEDARIQKLTDMEKDQYLEALKVNERDRIVIYEGGYIVGKKEGIELGIEQGIEQGVEKNRRENARAMLADGVEEAKVAKYTGLTPEEIRELVQ